MPDTGSPAINAARFLATIASISGNTLTLGVNEAYAFAPSDWNIPNFSGDIVYSQNKAQARVVSRPAHNAIQVSNGSAFRASDRLTVIDFSGSAPDIGAIEYGSTPSTCANCCSTTETCPTAFTTVGSCTRCCASACQSAPDAGVPIASDGPPAPVDGGVTPSGDRGAMISSGCGCGVGDHATSPFFALLLLTFLWRHRGKQPRFFVRARDKTTRSRRVA